MLAYEAAKPPTTQPIARTKPYERRGMTIETVRRVMTRRVMMVLLVLVVGGLGDYGAFMLAEIAFSVSQSR